MFQSGDHVTLQPVKWSDSCSVVSYSFDSWTVVCQAPCLRNSPGKITRMGCHSFFHRIFLIQGSNWGLLHCRQIIYHMRYQGSSNLKLSEGFLVHLKKKFLIINLKSPHDLANLSLWDLIMYYSVSHPTIISCTYILPLLWTFLVHSHLGTLQ